MAIISEYTISKLYDGNQIYRAWASSPDGKDGFSTINSDQAYLGIYIGTQPPSGYQDYDWSKILGDKGDKGETGDRGEDGYQYRIEGNQAEVLRFMDSETGELTLSPDVFKIKIYDAKQGTDAEAISETEVDYVISVMSSTGDVEELENSRYSNYLSFQGKTCSIKLQDLLIAKYGTDAPGEIELDPQFANVQEILSYQAGATLRVQVFEKGSPEEMYGQLLIPISWGTTQNMAQLGVYADSINASIQSTSLSFSGSGLTVRNGGLTILNKAEEEVFAADTDGNLIIHGEIHATSGSFSGEIYANRGTLGDLTVRGLITVGDTLNIDGRFTLPDGTANSLTGIYSTNYDRALGTGFFLSREGGIFAGNIILGRSATIDESINMGEAWILNPRNENSNNHFLRVGAEDNYSFLVKGDGSVYSSGGLEIGGGNNKIGGSIRVGSDDNYILIDGAHQSMQSSKYLQSFTSGWSLKGDGSAIFNNATIRGTLETTVLEYASVQTVGGLMVVRPSTMIASATEESDVVLTVDNPRGFEVGDWCQLSSRLGSWFRITAIDKQDITIDTTKEADEFVGEALISFGASGDIGIGLNSTNANSLIAPNSLSVFELQDDNSLSTKVILGQIPNEETFGPFRGSYGLYADNVYLKGALISEYDGISGGINTKSTAQESREFFSNPGDVLLWAGANGTGNEAIQNAKFRVDRNGNVYAGSGYFSGTIITDATITAAEIRTATLMGYDVGSGANAALTIQDATLGIEFKAGNKTKASLSNSYFALTDIPLMVGRSFKVDVAGNVIGNEIMSPTGNTILSKNRLGFTYSETLPNGNTPIHTGMVYNDGLELLSNNNTVLIANERAIQNKMDTDFERNIYMSEKVEIRQIKNNGKTVGYDVYVTA